jgi:putative ABC transport system permease protein
MPRLLHRLLGGLRGLFRPHSLDQDLDEELRAYLDAATERHLHAGMTHADAVRAARIEVGSTTAIKDHVRDAGWESRLDDLAQDARYALRLLWATRAFTVVAVLTLTLAIGANTAIFSVVNGLLLRALPVAAPDQLALVSTARAVEQGFPAGWNYAVWKQIQERADPIGRAVAFTIFPERLDLAKSGEADLVDGLFVSGNFFQELGVVPVVGRTFAIDEDRLGSPETRVAVISYGFWQRRYAGDADMIGRSILIERHPVTIIGVTPPQFLGPEVGRAFDIAMPIGSVPLITSDERWGTPAGRSYLAVMLRLAPDASMDSATTQLRAMHRQILQAAMAPTTVWGENEDRQLADPFVLAPASAGTSELRRQYSRAVITILVIAGLVLLIACANIANLLLARSATRHRELSVRVALGAPRRRLVQLMLVESLILASLGAMGGLLLANWASSLLVAQMSTWFERVALDVSLDWRVVAFTLVVTIATAIIFGTAPALRASLVSPMAVLRDPQTLGRGRRSRLAWLPTRSGLVVTQVALSLVLLITAGLFIRTFERLVAVPLGFESGRVLIADINANRTSDAKGVRLALYRDLAANVAALPGVANAAVSINTPANRGVTLMSEFAAPGTPAPGSQRVESIVNYVTPGWFEVYGMSMRAGRSFEDRDTAAAAPVAVVNEAFVRRFFSGRPAVGESIADAIAFKGAPSPARTIVGVVGNAREQSPRYDAFPTVFLPLAQWATFMPELPQVNLSIRTSADAPVAIAGPVATVLTATDARLAFNFRPLEEQIDAARHQERLIAWLSAFFGGLALLLAAIGLFGIASSTVARRRTEIGIRLALGAQRRDVVSLAIRHTVLATLAGLAIGLATAAAVTRYVDALLFGITPLDPVTFVAAPTILALVAGLAAMVPARRAARVDPMATLRSE